jgi:hypothetical protein
VFVAAYPVPANRFAGESRREVAFETCLLEAGDRAAMAFTSTERLVEMLGPSQPWVALPVKRLCELMGLADIPQVAIDPVLPTNLRRWRSDDIRRLLEEGTR